MVTIAGGFDRCWEALRHRIMSRNLLKRWKGKFWYGDSVKIEGAGNKDGIYKVVDTMNARFKNRIDFLETVGTKNYKYENVILSKI